MINFLPISLQPERVYERDVVGKESEKRIQLQPKDGYVLFGHFGFLPTDGQPHKVFLTRMIPTVMGDSLELYFYNSEQNPVEIEVFSWQIKKPV